MKTSRPLSIKTFKDSCTKNKTRENTSHRLFPYGKDSRFHISIATIRADRKEWMKSVTYGRWSRTRRPAALRNGARYNPPSGARKIRPGAGKRPECSTHWATRGAPWRVMNRATDRQSPRERNRETDRERERERERERRTDREGQPRVACASFNRFLRGSAAAPTVHKTGFGSFMTLVYLDSRPRTPRSNTHLITKASPPERKIKTKKREKNPRALT